jgi:hypothetical protein
MWLGVVKVIKPFLEFLKSFDVREAHNMMAIMLDPCFRALRIMENLVGHGMQSNWHLSMMSRFLFLF